MRVLALLCLLLAAGAEAQDPVAPDPGLRQDSGADSDAGADTGAATTADDTDADDTDADEVDPDVEVLPEANQPRLSVEVEPREGLVTGDLFTLTLRADALKDDDLAVPREQDFSPFDVLDRRSRIEEGQARAVHFFELDLLALEPGEHEIPAIRIRVVTADGIVGEVHSEPVTLTVGSVLGNEPDAQPMPASEPIQVWEDDYTLLWVLGILGGILVTALLTLLFARWWRRREKEAAPPPPPRPAWEIAVEKLEGLRRDRETAVQEQRIVEWVDGVSDAVREYLGHRYSFDGLESTTDEIVHELGGRKLIGIDHSEVAAFLHDCDLVKFAKATFDGEQCDELLGGAFRIVRTTSHRPAPRPPPPIAQPVGQPAAQTHPHHGHALAHPHHGHAQAMQAVPPVAAQPAHPDARWMPADEPPADEQPADEPPAVIPQTQELPASSFESSTEPDAVREIPQTREMPAPELPQIPQTTPPPSGADTLPEQRMEIPRPVSSDPEEPT